MKLILKEYLASLRERDELDVVLPDLLSQMGLNIFISPSRGGKEYGVDVAAVGAINKDKKKVYLFSIKSGNLTSESWDGNQKQSLRPSLNLIRDTFINSRLPPEYHGIPVVICLCFGGQVSSIIRQEVSGYMISNTNERISFEEWNGDKIADLILENMFKEELLPKKWQSYLRKSLSLVEEPESSSQHFNALARLILEDDSDKKIVKSLKQLNLVLWVLFAWCREDENLESSYLSVEYSLLLAWSTVKKYQRKRTVNIAFKKILQTYHTITEAYFDKTIFPFTDKRHLISHLISAPCPISINLKLFNILGRLAVRGQWLLFELTELYKKDVSKNFESEEIELLQDKLSKVKKAINLLVVNNPLLLTPYKDDQTIDLVLALHLLYQSSDDDDFVKSWLEPIIDRVTFSYESNGMYPTNLYTYEQLLEHRNKEKTDMDYKESMTKASILYPAITLFCELYEMKDLAEVLEDFCNKNLKHCTLQYWYPNEISEDYLFSGANQHGIATTNFPINGKAAREHVEEECKHSNFFWELTAVKQGYMPLVLVACRFYRYPMPFNLLFPEQK
ncbi:hypothetical protein [Pseudoalteromonas rhizosphaerae]|uniref:Chemotaxis protein n=1 Tax=Pseudoalteromonas rhizosphaerae TaxID=2518973 RepID=A0ABW8L6L3_9GAMM